MSNKIAMGSDNRTLFVSVSGDVKDPDGRWVDLLKSTIHSAGNAAALANVIKKPGVHEVRSDGSRPAGGVYPCPLTAPGVNQVKKMSLVK